MGFQRGLLRLEFEGEFAGLEMRSHRFSVGELLDVMTFPARINSGPVEERQEALGQMAALLDSKVIDWNYLDEEGLPVEKCVKAFRGLDQEFLEAVLRGIVVGSKQVAAPLETPSADTSLEESIPMVPMADPPS